ncbi:hypothetical protein BDV59DRAFT_143900 [Aspergillus ambiguus]|uniref:VHS and GAT domain-containing protein n=1 Tax=Aspergillus ambiguus TaxID=176160 RepID=UPI003CCDEE4F
MKRILSSLNTKRSSPTRDSPAAAYPDDSPEAVILREVNAFCEASTNPGNAHGSEYVRLPSIVESAESSPNAAREAANLIRKLLSEPNKTPSHMQYNAVMLIRILVDNPGHTFARNLDSKFAATVKDLLRQKKDMHVHNFVCQTLDALDAQRAWDEDLTPLLQMWRKEKPKLLRAHSNSHFRSSSQSPHARPPYPPAQNYATLPPPDELAARVEEAKTSAQLLMQFVQMTPPSELLENELIKEFSDRCRSAARAMQTYIHSTNPPPDEDTLLTLIEANDRLSVAQSKHQHAILHARKALGQSGSQSPASSKDNASASGGLPPVPAPPLPHRDSGTPPTMSSMSPVSPESTSAPMPTLVSSPISPPAPTTTNSSAAGRYEYRSEDFQVQNPFADNYSTTATPPTAK